MASVFPALLLGLSLTPSAEAQGLSPYASPQGQSCGLDCFVSWLSDMGSATEFLSGAEAILGGLTDGLGFLSEYVDNDDLDALLLELTDLEAQTGELLGTMEMAEDTANALLKEFEALRKAAEAGNLQEAGEALQSLVGMLTDLNENGLTPAVGTGNQQSTRPGYNGGHSQNGRQPRANGNQGQGQGGQYGNGQGGQGQGGQGQGGPSGSGSGSGSSGSGTGPGSSGGQSGQGGSGQQPGASGGQGQSSGQATPTPGVLRRFMRIFNRSNQRPTQRPGSN